MESNIIRAIDWREGIWTHPPAASLIDGNDLLVTAIKGSDAWRHTYYGFIHDSEHALLMPFDTDSAVEVSFIAAFEEQFDQAGVFLRIDECHWIKAGVEFASGQPQLGAVVTNCSSDWSLAPVSSWSGRKVTIRASRSGDAVTIRARVDDEPFRMVRLAQLVDEAVVSAGPFCCAPTRSGLQVRFLSWVVTDADADLP
jgi:regulation of enolase protein 1 (concanavalin A-like superfamily)